jgi:hypothetical protein
LPTFTATELPADDRDRVGEGLVLVRRHAPEIS